MLIEIITGLEYMWQLKDKEKDKKGGNKYFDDCIMGMMQAFVLMSGLEWLLQDLCLGYLLTLINIFGEFMYDIIIDNLDIMSMFYFYYPLFIAHFLLTAWNVGSIERACTNFFGDWGDFLKRYGKGIVAGVLGKLIGVFLLSLLGVPIIFILPIYGSVSRWILLCIITTVQSYYEEKICRQGVHNFLDMLWKENGIELEGYKKTYNAIISGIIFGALHRPWFYTMAFLDYLCAIAYHSTAGFWYGYMYELEKEELKACGRPSLGTALGATSAMHFVHNAWVLTTFPFRILFSANSESDVVSAVESASVLEACLCWFAGFIVNGLDYIGYNIAHYAFNSTPENSKNLPKNAGAIKYAETIEGEVVSIVLNQKLAYAA